MTYSIDRCVMAYSVVTRSELDRIKSLVFSKVGEPIYPTSSNEATTSGHESRPTDVLRNQSGPPRRPNSHESFRAKDALKWEDGPASSARKGSVSSATAKAPVAVEPSAPKCVPQSVAKPHLS